MPARPGNDAIVLAATGRDSLADALEWIDDDHVLKRDTDLQALLAAVLEHQGDEPAALGAARQLARTIAESEIDSAAMLFQPDIVVSVDEFRETLATLASRCKNDSLAEITADAVIAAQRVDPLTIETLCAIAGLSYTDLSARVRDLPASPRGRWSPSRIRRTFGMIDRIVRGKVSAELSDAIPARSLEFLSDLGLGEDGWEAVENWRTRGIPYEALLAQRAAGGAWLAHRNRTSSKVAPLLADRLCDELDDRGIDYLRSTSVGGEVSPAKLAKESGCDQQIGLLATSSSDGARYAVIFSFARDSGTASKSASRLRAMHKPLGLPAAVLVSGRGWAARNETADLAAAFGGRIYSDRDIKKLAEDIKAALDGGNGGNP